MSEPHELITQEQIDRLQTDMARCNFCHGSGTRKCDDGVVRLCSNGCSEIRAALATIAAQNARIEAAEDIIGSLIDELRRRAHVVIYSDQKLEAYGRDYPEEPK